VKVRKLTGSETGIGATTFRRGKTKKLKSYLAWR